MSAPEPRRVLIATTLMTTASGTVTYTRDLTISLLRHGWLPIVYATRTGAQAEVLRQATIPVVSELSSVGAAPDVIHGHHALETLAALARFPKVPALFVSHDARAWHSMPPTVPRIRTFVAVDRNCRDRMVLEHGVNADRVHVLANGVDMARFRPRPPLPPRPSRALVFSNAAAESTFLGPIRAACAQRGIDVDIVGLASGAAVERPEEILARYDLVFAKARCAIEAAAVGAAVIGCDSSGISGMITTARVEAMRQLNFGVRTLQIPITTENVLREIDLYDPVDAAAVSAQIRASNDSDIIAEQFIALYEELLREPLPPLEDEGAAMSASLERIAQNLYAQLGAGPNAYGKSSRLLRFVRRLLGG